jgi:hypothetical protein
MAAWRSASCRRRSGIEGYFEQEIVAEVRATHPGIQLSLVSPGVVRTDFGLNALHGGPDSRQFPGSQSPEEVAAVIAGVITSRAPDVYTRPGMQTQVVAYYAALGVDP